MPLPQRPANFDRIARLYRWLEYLSFGPILQACRTEFLGELKTRRRALVLGDGDGRFLARLLRENPELHAHPVDSSAAMLRLLSRRAARIGATARLTVTQADVASFSPPGGGYDVVITHFFLDCLSDAEIDALLTRIRPKLAPDALWVVSEFATPGTGSSLIVRGLYFGFRLLTGLRVTRLPGHSALLSRHGFVLLHRRKRVGGLLLSELWQRQATGEPAQPSH